MWPPNSPDLNPMDYFTWGVIESRSNAVAHPNEKAQIVAIKRGFAELPHEQVVKACAGFRARKAFIDNDGDFIK